MLVTAREAGPRPAERTASRPCLFVENASSCHHLCSFDLSAPPTQTASHCWFFFVWKQKHGQRLFPIGRPVGRNQQNPAQGQAAGFSWSGTSWYSIWVSGRLRGNSWWAALTDRKRRKLKELNGDGVFCWQEQFIFKLLKRHFDASQLKML